MNINMVFFSILAVACSYMLGAVPFGLIFSKIAGVDIRKVGSGNIGATNVFRSVGKKLGVLVFALDACKGYVSAVFFPLIVPGETWISGVVPVLCGFAAIVGHNWPVYLNFKGGKGVATSAGALIGLAPAAVGVGFLAWALVFVLTGYVSLASMAAACVVAVSGWFFYCADSKVLPGVLTFLAVMAVVRHGSNIRRLIAGTESRAAWKNKKTD